MTALAPARTTVRPTSTRPGPSRPPGRGPGHQPRPSDLPSRQQRAAAERLAGALGRWYIDAQAGRVEVRQLRRLLTPTAEQRVMASVLRARARHRLGVRRPGTRLTVRRVLVSRRADHYEALALVDDGIRTVPVVAVLHPTRSGWRVSELARPDDGLPALPTPVVRERPGTYAPG